MTELCLRDLAEVQSMIESIREQLEKISLKLSRFDVEPGQEQKEK